MEDLYKSFADELESRKLEKAMVRTKKKLNDKPETKSSVKTKSTESHGDKLNRVYQAAIKDGAFSEAHKQYPNYNDISHSDHEHAIDHIQGHIQDKHGVEDSTGQLNDMISGGLA